MPTRLKHWLTENALTGHQLAQRADVSPRAVYNLIDGRGDRFSRSILSKIAGATNLTREQLLEEPVIIADRRSGDPRIDAMVRGIGQHLFTTGCAKELRRYIAPTFACYSPIFETRRGDGSREGREATLSWDQMCAANVRGQKAGGRREGISMPLSIDWITSDGDNDRARQLSVVMRSISKGEVDDLTYTDHLIILGLTQCLAEMTVVETPKIQSWWWMTLPRRLDNIPQYTPPRLSAQMGRKNI